MKPALPNLSLRRCLYWVAGFVAFWSFFLSVIATQHFISGAFQWKEAFQMTLNQWLPWTFLSPLILAFTFRFPIERVGWAGRTLLHALACAGAVLICVSLEDRIAPPAPPPWAREGTEPSYGPPPERGRPAMSEPFQAGQRLPGRGRQSPPFWFRVRFNLPIYFILASLGHAYVFSRRSRQRERHELELEASLAQARLQSLRMQLHPHFLFNTLNAISTLVYTDARAADEMIGGLSELLRLSLDSATEQEIPLARELHFLNCYLRIEQTRFGDRLRVEQSVSPETLAALVPALVLQPLVENAIRHGLEPKLAPGIIGISAQRVGDTLRISIRDTGIGLPPGAYGASVGQTGIGLANTRARLQSLYPNRHRFTLQNDPGGGGVAELEIPFHTETPSSPVLPKPS